MFVYSDLMISFTNIKFFNWLLLVQSLLTIFLNLTKGGYRLRFIDLEKKYTKEGKFTSVSEIKRSDTKKV